MEDLGDNHVEALKLLGRWQSYQEAVVIAEFTVLLSGEETNGPHIEKDS